MTEAFTRLSDADLKALIAALRSGRVAEPYTDLQLTRIMPASSASTVAAALAEFAKLGFSAEQIVATLELVEHDRSERGSAESDIDLVTSGPEAPGISNRDTPVVVRELFAHAQTSVLVVGYAIHQGQRVFEALAERMEALPNLDVKLFVNISRPDRDTTASDILVSRYAQRFKDKQWPKGCRLPEVYYDPRSVADDEPVHSSLHAKCVVVDAEQVFVSSANFTEAGQQRNIEVGLNIQSRWLAERLLRHFALLHENGLAIQAF